jgi:hypothetical protein
LKCCQDLGIGSERRRKSIPFNVLDPKLLKDYEDNILHPYEKDGVDFWWYDWQQGNQSALPGLNMLWAINHYLYWDRARQTDRPVILSRYCGLGGQRYPIGFSGDTFQSFATLRYLVKTTSMASNIGFPYWSHDIGGHQQGHKDGDLYLKFVQFAVFLADPESALLFGRDALEGSGPFLRGLWRARQTVSPSPPVSDPVSRQREPEDPIRPASRCSALSTMPIPTIAKPMPSLTGNISSARIFWSLP